MLARWATWLERFGQPLHLLFSALLLAVFMLFGMPAMQAVTADYTVPAGLPDLLFSYSPPRLFQMAESYGPAGRQAYISSRLTWDAVFPLVYTYFFLTVSCFCLQRLFPVGSRARQLSLLPIAAMLADLGENISVMAVLARYPAHAEFAAGLAAVFTPIKWLLVSLTVILALASLLGLVVRGSQPA